MLTSAVTTGYAATIGATSATGAAVRARYMRSPALPLSAPVIPIQTKLRGVARILCERRSRSALTTVIDDTAYPIRLAANGLGQRSSAALAPTWASARTTAPRNGQPSDHPENRRTPPGCQERSAMPITTPSAAAAACEGIFSPSSSAAATSANRGVVPETVLVTVGPRSSLERKLSSVTTAGKNRPTSANRIAAVALNWDRSSAKGAAAANSSVAVGMLIAAPERGSSERRPTLALTWAMPKHSELRSAKAIATLGLRQAQPPLDDLARRRERHLGDHDQALRQLVLR